MVADLESALEAAPGAATASGAGAVPATMRAVVQDGYGTVDVLRLEEIAVPAPGEREVLVRVHAAGIDRGTWHVMTGLPLVARAFLGLRRPRNRVAGLDLSGTVVAVGARITRLAVGDRVFGIGRGSFAPYAVAPERKLAPMPTRLSFEQAAAVPVSGLTALQALHAGRCAAGHRVLVIGASGGVGSYAVQIAAARGAQVTGVCSAAKCDLVLGLGATRAVDYAAEDIAPAGAGYDVIIDAAGGTPLRRLRAALAPRGALGIGGAEDGGRGTGGGGRAVRAALVAPFGHQRLTMLISREDHADLERLAALIDAGEVTPALDRTYPLAEVRDAMHRLEAGQMRGKLVIAPIP